MIAGASLHAQTGSIVRGAGIVYTDGPPNFDAHPKGAWIAIDTTSGYYWLWDKQAEDWVDGGGLIQSTGATGAPSYTPDLQHSRYAVNAGDSIFHYRAGSWRLASGALPDLSAYLQWGDTTTTIATKSDLAGVDLSAYPQRTELADTAAAIRGDFPTNTDAQTLSFSSPSLSISNGNSVNLSALVSGYITGSGTSGYVPYFTGASSIGNSGLYWDNANSRLGIGTTAPALQSGGSGLHINASVNSEIKFTNSTTGTTAGDGTAFVASGNSFRINNREVGNLTLGTSNTSRVTILSGGNVGIGQTFPTARLHVTGPGSTSATFNGRGENSSNVATWTSRDDGLFTAQKLSITSTTGPTWTSGTGSPEGVVTAPVGSIYSRTDGGAGTSLYVKESGAGNTGWVGK